MKKLVNKIRNRRKNLPPPSRITSETIEQHREHVLAGGRKFKYPLQYAKHKLVFNAIIIAIAAFIIAIVVGWWQLYPQQNTSEFMYRVTKVIPVPVAYINGQPVLYSDYLMKYLSSIRYLERKEQLNTKTDSGKRQVEYIKQKSMQYVVENAYAEKLAGQLDVSVSGDELDKYLKELRQTSAGEISEATNDAVIMDYYGWGSSEYRYIIKKELLRQKVSYVLDKKAQNVIDKVKANLDAKPKTSFKALTGALLKQSDSELSYGVSGWVPKTNQDGGIASAASALKKQGISGIIKSTLGDGYYIVRMLDTRDDQVRYEYIKAPLSEFQDSLDKLIEDGKVSELISIPDSNG